MANENIMSLNEESNLSIYSNTMQWPEKLWETILQKMSNLCENWNRRLIWRNEMKIVIWAGEMASESEQTQPYQWKKPRRRNQAENGAGISGSQAVMAIWRQRSQAD